MISLTGITKIYTVGNQRVAALDGVDLEIADVHSAIARCVHAKHQP